MKLRPFFASETYERPARNCRGSSGFFATMVATNNEANLNQFGRHLGKAGRTQVLRKMWRAFEQQVPRDDNGWADQGDVLLMHRAAFPGLPDPLVRQYTKGEDVYDLIGPNAVSMAILPGAVPAGHPIRRWVGDVPHQGVAWKKRVKGGKLQVRWVCPMHPASDTFTGVWVDWDDLARCAKAVPASLAGKAGNTFFVEVYKAGGWTHAARSTKELLEVARQRRVRIVGLVEQVQDLGTQIGDRQALIKDLEKRLADSQSGTVTGKAAGWESALVRSIGVLQSLRTEGPPGGTPT